MKKRIFIALAAALSVTMGAAFTLGVMARSSTPAPSEGTAQTSADLKQLREEAKEDAACVAFRPLNETRLALADEAASGCPSEERLEAIREELRESDESIEQYYAVLNRKISFSSVVWFNGYMRYCYGTDADNYPKKGSSEFLEAYNSETGKYEAYVPDAFFDAMSEQIRTQHGDISQQQLRTIMLRRLFLCSDDYSEAVLLGKADPDAPKLTPERAADIISASDGNMQKVLEAFKNVQPYPDGSNTLHRDGQEPDAVSQSGNYQAVAKYFPSLTQYVTKNDDGVYSVVLVVSEKMVYCNRYDESGTLLSCECLMQPSASVTP